LRVHIYIPAEGRVIASALPDLPVIGDIVMAQGRAYQVTAVQNGQSPAVISLESCNRQGPTASDREKAKHESGVSTQP